MTRQLIAEITTGSRTVAGTSWPISTQVHREQTKWDKRPRWIATFNLCNGVPDSAKSFTTKKEAWDAAWDAAGDAEKKWQEEKLREMPAR